MRFDIFKKKTKKKTAPIEPKSLTAEEMTSIVMEIRKQLVVIESIDSTKTGELALEYEKLGTLQEKINIDDSIASLEKSLSYEASIGNAYKILIKLYNQKRSEAAFKGDDKEIEQWMSKMDDLRQIARSKTISN